MSQEPISITLFNHKGGVGKTTLTVNLAFAFAELGMRILLVDSDPQCNLTSYLIDAEVVNKLLDESEGPKGQTIWSAVKPVVDASGPAKRILPYERAEGVFLIPGDIKLSELEISLQQSWTDCLQRKIRGFKETCAIESVANDCARQVSADIILYDIGPNIGPLNRAIILGSDYFVVPAACDHFSTRALKTLGYTVANWIRDWALISQLAPENAPLLAGSPRYLGYVLQRFRMYGGEIVSGSKEFARELDKKSFSDIVSVLREIDPALAPSQSTNFSLGQIKDFNRLAALSQLQGTAIYEVDGASASERLTAKTAFIALANKILLRIGSRNGA